MEYTAIRELLFRYPSLTACEAAISDGYRILEKTYEDGGKLLIAGNGGSAADSEHIAGELMKRFRLPRPVPAALTEKLIAVDPVRGKMLSERLERPLTAIPLTAHEALTTAYANDVEPAAVFAQQLYGFGRRGDTLLALSTSGNSENILNAAVVARALGIRVVALTGGDGGRLARAADVAVCVPEAETYKVQELHLPIYHCWCRMLEEHFFGRADLSDD